MEQGKMKKKASSLRIACRTSSVQDELDTVMKKMPIANGMDVCWGERRVPLSHGRHHGGYVCAFRGQPLVRVESMLERSVIKMLVADPACMAVASQPVTLRWMWRESKRRYTPDVLVLFDAVPEQWRQLGAERFSLIEVKPPRVHIDSDLMAERARIVRATLGMPLVRLPALQEVQA